MVPLRVHQDTIYITKNLALALRHLRRMASPRVLWIDALCINQIDIAERNHQVAQMRYIYENAVEVLVWLGEEQIHTITGLKTLAHLTGQCLLDERSNKQKWFQGDSSRKFPELSKTAIGVADILSRHWWRRVWVVQEVALSKRATLHCGHVSLSWPPRDRLKSSIDNFRHYAERESGLEKLMKRMLDMLQIQLCEFDSVKPSLLDLLYQFHDRLSTDPRDRVFALLSLASDEEAAQNLPDYSLSQSIRL